MTSSRMQLHGVWRVLVLVLCAAASTADLRAARVAEHDLKAVFLYQFAQFVDWPPEAFASPDAPFVIGLFGPDSLGGAIEEVVRNEIVKGRSFVVQRYRTPNEIGVCHILFVSARGMAEIAPGLPALAARHVLTVGESDDFVQRGGAVGFRRENQRLRIRINLGAARAAQLTISSKLLRAADIVNRGDLGFLSWASDRFSAD